ncbi:hypothetical protein [Pseudomonas sp. P1.8]|uniref:hypothetical protein n=1 Tax=Pseudomonas sp. P1.8 TaxID=1699310 RepID=UPI00069EE52D|nr:hypothetical protein [Pseudomonas sp. P1.8]
MLETIKAIATAYWYIVVPVIATLIMMIPVIVYWEKVRYGLMIARHRFPLIGTISYWVKNPGKQDAQTHFLKSETELCGAYHHYYLKHSKDGTFYKKAEDYLLKVNEDGRKEKGLMLWALILTLMVVEASAFGYALAPYVLAMATPNTAMITAWGIGLVISVVGLYLSEKSGHQLYINHKINQVMAYSSMRESGSAGDFIRKDRLNIDKTFEDDDRPAYQQMLNRIQVGGDTAKPSKSFNYLIIYSVFIVGLAIAAFAVRTETLKATEAELISNPISMSMEQAPPDSNSFDLGEDMQEVKQASVSKSAQDQIDSMHRASMITFAVLSALFCFIQFTSTIMAYSRGFAGSHSSEAWKTTRGFANADEFIVHHETIARSIAVDAQRALGNLQALLSAQFHISGNDNNEKEINKHERTFERFLAIKHAEKMVKDQRDVLSGILDNLNKQSTELAKKGDQAGSDLAMAKANEIRARINSLNGTETVAAPAPAVVAAKTEPAHAATPVVHAAPAPAVEVVNPEPVAAVAQAGFDPHAWGNLMGFEEDDLDYVAGKKGVDIALIRRAYKLQKLDAELS